MLPLFSRAKLADAASEIADHLKLVDHVKSLQDGQKLLADAIADINKQLHGIETQIATMKAEVRLDALKEAQAVVYATQSGLNERLEQLAVKVGVMDATERMSRAHAAGHSPAPTLSDESRSA